MTKRKYETKDRKPSRLIAAPGAIEYDAAIRIPSPDPLLLRLKEAHSERLQCE